jgi:hypothetical protein
MEAANKLNLGAEGTPKVAKAAQTKEKTNNIIFSIIYDPPNRTGFATEPAGAGVAAPVNKVEA